MKNLKRFSLALLAASVAASVSAETQFAPYLNVEVSGGQSFFSRDNDSPVTGPNGSVLFVPGMRMSDKFSIVPTLAYGYQQVRDVQELAGGGFLTQKQMSGLASLKGIYVLSPGWKGKAYASFKQQYYKETADESWGDGLFDYDKTAVGLEAEREGQSWKSLRFGLDYYMTQFQNFQSLASRQFGAEINAGEDVLDFNAMDASVGADLKLGEKSLVSGYLSASDRDYADQNIVKLDGTYSSETRRDLYLYTSLGYRYKLPTVSLFGLGVESLTGLDLSYASLGSDQNNYDASRTQFNEDYYDYSEIGIGPRMNLRFNEKVSLGLSYMTVARDYSDRPIQYSDGIYSTGGETIVRHTNTFRWSMGYPLMKSLTLQAQGAYENASSNMEYETVYRYNYTSSHYFLGLSYQL